jgi:hypothetical protein
MSPVEQDEVVPAAYVTGQIDGTAAHEIEAHRGEGVSGS